MIPPVMCSTLAPVAPAHLRWRCAAYWATASPTRPARGVLSPSALKAARGTRS